MFYKIVFIFTITFFLKPSDSQRPPPPPVQGLGNFQDYVLAIQNPLSFCQTQNPQCNLQRGTNKFTVHGLWPQAFPNQGLTCSKEDFNRRKASRVKKVKQKWINAADSSDGGWEGFLKHEWEKHGRCSDLPQVKYYEEALRLYDHVMEKLPKLAIGKQINITVLRWELNSHLFGEPEILCARDSLNPRKRLPLEIRFLLDKKLAVFGQNPKKGQQNDCDPRVNYTSWYVPN